MENPETSRNCSKFKFPWGNGPCFITGRGAGGSKRGGGTHGTGHGGDVAWREFTHRLRRGGRRAGTRERSQTCARARGERYLRLGSRLLPAPSRAPSPRPEGVGRHGASGRSESRSPAAAGELDVESCPGPGETANAPGPTAVPALSHDGCGAVSILGNKGPKRPFGLPKCCVPISEAAWKMCLRLNK